MVKLIKAIKCPYCGRTIEKTKSGNVKPHIQSTKIKCWASGQSWFYIEHLRLLKDKKTCLNCIYSDFSTNFNSNSGKYPNQKKYNIGRCSFYSPKIMNTRKDRTCRHWSEKRK